VVLVPGPDGIYPVIWRLDATNADAIHHLTEGEGCTRSGRVRYLRERGEVFNRFRLEYAIRADSGKFRRELTLGPDAPAADPTSGRAPLEYGSALVRMSAARYGIRSRSLSSAFLWDDATAALILHWLARWEGFVHRGLDVEVEPDQAWLRPGDIVTYTATDLHLSARVCIVTGWAWTGAGATLSLLIVEDPVTAGRPV
jgi:hypothetical protein